MSAKLKASYWGSEVEGMCKESMKMIGDAPDCMTPSKIKDVTDKCEAEWTARECVQHFTSSWGNHSMEKPKQLEECFEALEVLGQRLTLGGRRFGDIREVDDPGNGVARTTRPMFACPKTGSELFVGGFRRKGPSVEGHQAV